MNNYAVIVVLNSIIDSLYSITDHRRTQSTAGSYKYDDSRSRYAMRKKNRRKKDGQLAVNFYSVFFFSIGETSLFSKMTCKLYL